MPHSHAHSSTLAFDLGQLFRMQAPGTPGMLKTGAHAQAAPSVTRHTATAFVTLLHFETLTCAPTGIHTTWSTFTTSHPHVGLATLSGITTGPQLESKHNHRSPVRPHRPAGSHGHTATGQRTGPDLSIPGHTLTRTDTADHTQPFPAP